MKKHVRTIMTVLLSICILLSRISVCVSLPISRPNSRVYWRESCVIQTIRQSACIKAGSGFFCISSTILMLRNK